MRCLWHPKRHRFLNWYLSQTPNIPSLMNSLPLIGQVQQSQRGRYLQQRREEHDCQGGHQLILTLFLDLNTNQEIRQSHTKNTHTVPHGGPCAVPPLWSSWWSAVREWGSSLDPSSPSPPGSSGSWTDPPNTSALETEQAEMNQDPRVLSKQRAGLERKHVGNSYKSTKKDTI